MIIHVIKFTSAQSIDFFFPLGSLPFLAFAAELPPPGP